MIVPLEDDLVNISQFWWPFFFFKSENFFFQIWYISPIPVEHYTEKRKKHLK